MHGDCTPMRAGEAWECLPETGADDVSTTSRSFTAFRPTLDTMSLATKKDEENGLSTYYNNKTTVIQEARVFNDSPISPRKCRALLTRIVYLLYVGETFSTQEATTLFFGTTKLFQHKDVSNVSPRRLRY